ncbi:MAG: HPr family phosphocarrier protein [Candidatus Omnitrophota bacterium]|nr:MAG: HPr family phosphocarrier protein [Candidatus Omnitrophota bacterium]
MREREQKSKCFCIKRKVIIKNRLGLHARPAALFVQLANRFESEIIMRKGNQEVNGKSIMGVMMLAAGKGEEVEIEAKGVDAERAVRELEKLLMSDLEG